MSVRGALVVAGVESTKLARQLRVRLVLIAGVASPFAFAGAMRVQSSVPADTLFGRAVTDTGFALPLVVLGFGALWVFPVLASSVGGDMFSAEDRYGTWTTGPTRSRSRAEVFAGKVVAAMGFSLIATTVLAVSSIAAGALVIGEQPLIGLSGALLSPAQALVRVSLAWVSVLPPAIGFTALALLISVAARSSAAGIGLPVLVGLVTQLYALVDGPEAFRRLLIASAFGAWHGLLSEPPYYRPVVHGTAMSVVYVVLCLGVAYRILRRRDIGR